MNVGWGRNLFHDSRAPTSGNFGGSRWREGRGLEGGAGHVGRGLHSIWAETRKIIKGCNYFAHRVRWFNSYTIIFQIELENLSHLHIPFKVGEHSVDLGEMFEVNVASVALPKS